MTTEGKREQRSLLEGMIILPYCGTNEDQINLINMTHYPFLHENRDINRAAHRLHRCMSHELHRTRYVL